MSDDLSDRRVEKARAVGDVLLLTERWVHALVEQFGLTEEAMLAVARFAYEAGLLEGWERGKAYTLGKAPP